MKPTTTLYLAWWPAFEIFKVGVTNRTSRLRKHETHGARILSTIPDVTTAHEREAINHVRMAFDPAFKTWEEAVPVLGSRGLGFTECFRVPTRHLLGAWELACMGVRRCP